MRRIGGQAFVVLALLLLFSLGTASAKDFDSKKITVNAVVGDRAELTCQRDSVALDRFTGRAYEQRFLMLGSAVRCQSTQNRPVQLHVQFAPLTHVEADTPIGTAISVDAPGYVEVGPDYELRGDPEGKVKLITGPWNTNRGFPPFGSSDYTDWEFADSGTLELAGPTSRPLRIEIWGRLQEVFQQAAGDYTTEIVLTVSD